MPPSTCSEAMANAMRPSASLVDDQDAHWRVGRTLPDMQGPADDKKFVLSLFSCYAGVTDYLENGRRASATSGRYPGSGRTSLQSLQVKGRYDGRQLEVAANASFSAPNVFPPLALVMALNAGKLREEKQVPSRQR